MSYREFRKYLATMTRLDMTDLVGAKVLRYTDHIAFEYYRSNPWRWMLNADEDQGERLWKLIQERARKPVVEDVEV